MNNQGAVAIMPWRFFIAVMIPETDQPEWRRILPPVCRNTCTPNKYIILDRAGSWRSLAARWRYVQYAGMLVNAVMVYGYGYRYNAVVQYSRNDTVGRRYCR